MNHFHWMTKCRVGRSAFPVQAPLEPNSASEKMAGVFSFYYIQKRIRVFWFEALPPFFPKRTVLTPCGA
ncbi:hypothetical protein BBR47_11960 [Brevibacillus brevis NBRC 100599]|uniref:Uncharacterized protein n=1 Tax=Brevibacillus brevis (strain 47 / JCM 6285 / NBRC 100599) TaxID=358681 RepID=C0Z7D0_BREBN|nr:hypothetical protein BBR47_11960 [Brevibacillus brevis NBRC 100599]